MPSKAPDNSLDDVQVLGTWNFTLQGDTPLYWLRTGQLDRYLLKFRVTHQCPCVCGIVLHSEVDGPGTDGASFWIERRPPSKEGGEATKRYVLAGEGLDSKPIVTRSFPDPGGEAAEEVEVLMEGYEGSILLQNRKVSLRFRTKHNKGSVAFYNSTQGDNDDIHFGGIRITALRRGPLEIDGKLLKRERNLERFSEQDIMGQAEEVTSPMQAKSHSTSRTRDSQSTMIPDFVAPRSHSTTSFGSFSRVAAGGGGGTPSEFYSTMPSRGPQGSSTMRQLASPTGSVRSSMKVGGRGAANKGRLQMSMSDGALRKSGGVIGGASTTSGGMWDQPAKSGGMWDQPDKKQSRSWVPLALNAPCGEQQLLKSISRRPVNPKKDCTDFIPM
mmetsp:Transcript_85312/g.275325  ORF Transcript_85312/g.275325 Transcript_85312/m.275325 type:complete len:385 (-) Transcript_85312:33-1187(-)